MFPLIFSQTESHPKENSFLFAISRQICKGEPKCIYQYFPRWTVLPYCKEVCFKLYTSLHTEAMLLFLSTVSILFWEYFQTSTICTSLHICEEKGILSNRTAVNKPREIYTLTSKFLSARFALLVSVMIKRESLTHWKIAVAPTQKSNQQSFISGFFNYPSDFPVCSP